MPYIIAVLALVILGTGYTLFQKTPSTITEQTDTSSVTVVEASQAEPQVATEIFDDSDKRDADEDEKDDFDDNPSPSDTLEQPVTPKPAPTPVAVPVADNNTYTNGTYYATKSYRTPDGTYQMNVSVTVNNDEVTASTLSFDADGSRDGYSKRFSGGYQNQVLGKELGNITLSRVGGASLTTAAFNSALSNIKSQAS